MLADGVLHLRVGVRTEGSIPLAAIERVDALAEAPDRWRRRHGIHRADTLLVTPVDKPNCVLLMKPDAGLTLLHWQVRRSVPRYLLLYLDRPELLASRTGRLPCATVRRAALAPAFQPATLVSCPSRAHEVGGKHEVSDHYCHPVHRGIGGQSRAGGRHGDMGGLRP